MPPSASERLERARRCLDVEAAALTATRDALDSRFGDVLDRVHATLAAGRKLLFSGVGKSGAIARKLAATFNSVGAPSCFLDATDALHGDLGLCTGGDLAFLLSNSGATGELVRLLPLLRRFGVGTIALTGTPGSPLAGAADATLLYAVPAEACPLRLAPTASTTAALALGDALAMVLLEELGTTREDFARRHPSGALGAALLLRVSDVMRSGDRLAIAPLDASVQAGLLAMTAARAGSLVITDAAGRLAGIFTDGDFRRAALAHADLLLRPVAAFMTPNPITIAADALAADAVPIFQDRKIDDLVVLDHDRRPVGLIDAQDLPRLKLV